MSTNLDIKTHQLVTEYQQLLLLEKVALLACPAAKEAMIDLLLELQQPTRRRRINARQFAKWVTGLNRDLLTPASACGRTFRGAAQLGKLEHGEAIG